MEVGLPWTLRMTLYAFAIVILPYIFVGWRLNASLKLMFPDYSKFNRRIIIIFMIFVNLLPFMVLILYVTGHSNLLTHGQNISVIDILIVFPFWVGFLTVFELFFYFVAIDLIGLFVKKIPRNIEISFSKPAAYLRAFLFLFLFIYVAASVYFDTYTVRIDSYVSNIQNLPRELKDLKLTLVGDLQIDRYTQETKINDFHLQLKRSDPDILFFAGDLVTRGTHFIPQGLDVMCQTKAGIERIACVGDHDVWSNAAQIAHGLEACGWRFLDNSHRVISYKNRMILVTGITYVYSRRISRQQLDNLLAAAPRADVKILLVHQPSQMVIAAAKRNNYDLMLAGHTHGGQIVFKPFGMTITPTMFENSFYSGKYQLGSLHLFVTNGIGLTMMPLRFRAPAEIQQITLRPAP